MADLRSLVIEYLAALDADHALPLRRGVTRSDLVTSMKALSRALAALRAAVATPPDTGWRDRVPTEAEVRAHAEEHEALPGVGSWQWRGGDGLCHSVRLSHEVQMCLSKFRYCVTIPLASLEDRCDSVDLVAQDFARREDEWRRAMELEMESEMKTRAEMQERTKT